MNRKADAVLSIDELVAYLKRTNQPAILVEGSDDKKVYRYIEHKLEDIDADIIVCNSRSMLLAVYERRNEYAKSSVSFLADRDMWYFSNIPDKYRDQIVYTEGYSIENDLYVKELFEGLLSLPEQGEFAQLISNLSRWQAFHVERFLVHGFCECDAHVHQICDGNQLCTEYLATIGFLEPSGESVLRVATNYELALRGKTLFQALLKFLSSPGRASKYSRENLFEIGAKSENAKIEELCAKTRAVFHQNGLRLQVA